ncbi:hypothetical protein D3C74_50320 [compost metagenome]
MELREIAGSILLVGISESDIMADWQYRKGKDAKDIKKAVQKAIKNGRQKFEFEENMLEVYLSSVLKRRRRKPGGDNNDAALRK